MPSKGLLQIITGSEYRRDLLFYIGDSSKTLSEIKDYFEVTSPEIKPRIKEMEASNLIVKQDGAYQLTTVGKILSSYYKPLLDTITAIESNCDFWENHDLSAIPEGLLYRIRDLKDCKIVKAEEYKICASHIEFVKHVKSARSFKGVTSVFNPLWIDIFYELSSSRVPIEIITTNAVFEEIRSKHADKLEEGLKNKNAHLYVCYEPLKVAFAIIDGQDSKFLSLALNYIHNGQYDNNNDLEGYDQTSFKWGEELFKYYLDNSTEVKSIESINEAVIPKPYQQSLLV